MKPIDPADQNAPSVLLTVKKNGKVQLTQKLHQGRHILGRDPGCDIYLNDALVSQEHAQLFIHEDGITITDLGAYSGVFCSGKQITQSKVQLGDIVTIGPFALALDGITGIDSAVEEADTLRDMAPIPSAQQALDLIAEKKDSESATPDATVKLSKWQMQKALSRPVQKKVQEVDLNLQHAWYAATRHGTWKSLAVIPVDEETQAYGVAQGFAGMASQDSSLRVLAVDASTGGCEPAENATNEPIDLLWTRASLSRDDGANDCPYDVVNLSDFSLPDAERVLASVPQLVQRLASNSQFAHSTMIFSTDPPLLKPQATPICRAVEKVIICVTLGVTSLKATRKLIHLVGQEKILGSVALKA